ncbi:unnamed protein product, partial [Gongylonema pulchrum]|uniref:Uncharacterized protein n=1 Tax=Gongylonema pulchrum TaxID=637853 RepID=A0A183CWD9_9BILA
VNSSSCDVSRVPSIDHGSVVRESGTDGNERPALLLLDTRQPLERPHLRDTAALDEDSLLENLPRFDNCNKTSNDSWRNLNWSPLRPSSTRRDLEHYESSEQLARQRKLSTSIKCSPHREARVPTTRGTNETRPSGLPPIPTYQQTGNTWRKNLPSHSSRNYHSARPFSTSDGYIRNRERAGYERGYMGNSDRGRDCSQCRGSDNSRSNARIANHYGPTNRSSCSDGATESSFDLAAVAAAASDEKRIHGAGAGGGATMSSDCSATAAAAAHRMNKRFGSTRSRISPPVHLALKTPPQSFVDECGVEERTTGSAVVTVKASPAVASSNVQTIVVTSDLVAKEDNSGPGESYSFQQNAENLRAKTHDAVEQLANEFDERVTLGTRGYIFFFFFY